MFPRPKKPGGHKKVTNRKEKRKLERKEKKQKKMLYYSRKFGHDQAVPEKAVVPSVCPKKKKEKPKKIKEQKELTFADVRKMQLKEANEEEDKSIKRLEKILKLNRRKKKDIPKAFSSDGLDYILELIDRPEETPLTDFDMNLGDSEINDDLSKALGRTNQSQDDNSDQDFSQSDSDDEGHGEGFFIKPETVNTDKQILKRDTKDRDSISLGNKKKNIVKEIGPNDEESSDSDSEQGLLETKKGLKAKMPSRKDKEIDLSDGEEFSDSDSDRDLAEIKPKKGKGRKQHMSWDDDIESENEASSTNLLKIRKDEKSLASKKEKKRVKWDETTIKSKDEEVETENLEEDEECSEDDDSDWIDDDSNEDLKPKTKDPGYWEDIYGRLRDKDGGVVTGKNTSSAVGKYVPPAKRAKASSDDAKKREIQIRIQKQMRGLLNKLNESNMKHIADEIENLYMKHSRNDMNESLIHLVQQSVILPYFTPEKLVMENALLIALLHCNVGSEVGAHCLQTLASALDSKLKEGETYGEGKEIDNLLLLLCHLYTFKVTHHRLLYDILKRLADNFKEKDIELILLVLRSVGFVLRKDDPLELKNLILSLQTKSSAASHFADQSRIRFMLETLMVIRNNNMHKIPNYDPSLAEHLRKVLRALQRKGTYVQELNISLEDLLRAEDCGRWWVVGSAWQGNTLENREDNESKPAVVTNQFSEEVLELSRKQRMNTEVRKNIFCVIMSAEDYMDAFEKLLRLGLKNQQDREILHVAFDCCLQEKAFNPFYAYLVEKFCTLDRKYQMVLQFALWDKFKDMRKMKSYQVTNMAHFLVHLFTKNALPLSVLKTIQLSEMDKTLVKFLRQILLAILLNESEDVCRSVFLRIAPAPKLRTMRDGLRLFMMHFLLRNQDKLENETAGQLKERIDVAVSAMNSADDRKHR